jgi:hypothetical protein
MQVVHVSCMSRVVPRHQAVSTHWIGSPRGRNGALRDVDGDLPFQQHFCFYATLYFVVLPYLTPSNRVLLKKLTVTHLLKKPSHLWSTMVCALSCSHSISLLTILSYINPIYTLLPCFFIIIPPSMPRLSYHIQ